MGDQGRFNFRLILAMLIRKLDGKSLHFSLRRSTTQMFEERDVVRVSRVMIATLGPGRSVPSRS